MEDLVPRSFWQRTSTWIVGTLLGLGALFASCFLDVGGFLSGDTDIAGNYLFEEELAAVEDSMTPMEQIHARLFPRWLIAEANGRDTTVEFEALSQAVTDAELKAVLDALRAAIADGSIFRPPEVSDTEPDAGPVEPQPPVHFTLLQRWNSRLKALDQPFYVTGSISGTNAGPALLGQFYRRLSEPTVDVGGTSVATVVLQRIDRTNIVEWYLGVSERGGAAVVVTDRILDLATDRVWLMLNPETMPQDPLDLAYAEAIRAEASKGLSAEALATLKRTASERHRLIGAVESALGRGQCGSTLRFGSVEWDGFDPRTLDRLTAYAERDKIQPCPAVTFEEADTFRATSEALRADATKHALQELVSWLTRMIAIHEARHAADYDARGGLETPETCPGCPERMSASTRAELSAYLATIAWSDSPATAMYQACTVQGGPHGRAMRFLSQQLNRQCGDEPPADLAQKARELESTLFGEAQPMKLAEDFPKELEIHRYR